MSFNPCRVVARLVSEFGQSSDSKLSRSEQKLVGALIRLIRSAADGCATVDEEDDLVWDEGEEVDPEWSADDDEEVVANDLDDVIMFSDTRVPLDEVRRAVKFYRSSAKKSRPLSSLCHAFRFIKNKGDLNKIRMFEKKELLQAVHVTRIQGLGRIRSLLKEWATTKFNEGIPLRDADLRRMALMFNRTHGHVANFKASHSWMQSFKRHAGFCSRRITTFVTKKNHRDKGIIEQEGKKFVDEVRENMKHIPLEIVVNADQSGFLKEMHTPRCLAPIGTKKVERIVQSNSAITHSYTVMPMLYANGRLGEKLFVVLQEPNGKLPTRKLPYNAPNLIVRAGTSHIMTKAHMIDWIREGVFSSSSPSSVYMIVDSWSSFRDTHTMQSAVPLGCQLVVKNIPPGCTSTIQPLDVFFFGPFKRVMKKISGHVLANELEFVLHRRDNILKVLSLVYKQFCAPVFEDFLKYPWHAAGYLDYHPGPFQTPAEVCFPHDIGTCNE